ISVPIRDGLGIVVFRDTAICAFKKPSVAEIQRSRRVNRNNHILFIRSSDVMVDFRISRLRIISVAALYGEIWVFGSQVNGSESRGRAGSLRRVPEAILVSQLVIDFIEHFFDRRLLRNFKKTAAGLARQTLHHLFAELAAIAAHAGPRSAAVVSAPTRVSL